MAFVMINREQTKKVEDIVPVAIYSFSFLPPASEGWGRYCFHGCLSINSVGGEVPLASGSRSFLERVTWPLVPGEEPLGESRGAFLGGRGTPWPLVPGGIDLPPASTVPLMHQRGTPYTPWPPPPASTEGYHHPPPDKRTSDTMPRR